MTRASHAKDRGVMVVIKLRRIKKMIRINIFIPGDKKPELTLREFVAKLKILNAIYGNDSEELNIAVGKLYDSIFNKNK